MQRKLITFGKQHKEFPGMVISFWTRANAMEICFGNFEKDEENIAASILKAILKLNVDIRGLAS